MKHVEMAFSFYLISEETKGYFAISRQISATSAPKDIMTDKTPKDNHNDFITTHKQPSLQKRREAQPRLTILSLL